MRGIDLPTYDTRNIELKATNDLEALLYFLTYAFFHLIRFVLERCSTYQQATT